MINTKKLGEAIRGRRRHLGLTLADVASKAGLSGAQLSRIENGSTPGSKPSLAAVLRALDVGEATAQFVLSDAASPGRFSEMGEWVDEKTGVTRGDGYLVLPRGAKKNGPVITGKGGFTLSMGGEFNRADIPDGPLPDGTRVVGLSLVLPGERVPDEPRFSPKQRLVADSYAYLCPELQKAFDRVLLGFIVQENTRRREGRLPDLEPLPADVLESLKQE